MLHLTGSQWIQADHDTKGYRTKVKVSDADLAAVALHRHDFHDDWNYTITGG